MKKLFFNKLPIGAYLCVIVVLLFFIPNFLQGKIPIPADSLIGLYHPFRDISIDGYNPGKFPVKNPLITDPVLQTYPWRTLVIQSIKNGQMPFWNPYSFSGQPLLANIQSSTFSVFNILFFVLPFKLAWGFQIVSSSVLAALFMFLFLRNLKLTNLAAAFGGIVLAFSGFFIAWLEWGTIVTTALWLPLILLSWNKISGKHKAVWYLVLVFALVQTFVGGHLQTALYLVLAFIAYSIYEGFANKKFLHILLAPLALLTAAAIASPQLLPSLEFIQNSARGSDQGYYPSRQDWFIPPQNLVQVVIPDYFGNPTTYNYWGIWNYAEFVTFIGVIPFFFVLLYMITRKKEGMFFVFLLFVSLSLALENFISRLPYTLNLPFISSLQPSRIILLVDFSLSVLVAYGINYLLQTKNKSRKVFIASLLTILLVLTATVVTFVFGKDFPKVDNIDAQNVAFKNSIVPLAFAGSLLGLVIFNQVFKSKGRIIIWLIIALSMVELFRFGYKFLPFSKYEWIYPQTKIISYLQKQPKPFRIISTDRRIMHPNVSSYYGIESVDGYDPLYLKIYGQFIASWQGDEYKNQVPSFNRIITPQKLNSPALDLLNVEYVLSFDEITNPRFSKIMVEGDTKLYKNRNALPRIFFVDEIEKVTNAVAFKNIVKNPGDLKRKAYSKSISIGKNEGTAQAKIIRYTSNQIAIETTSTSQKPLVIANVNDNGWTAKIDGNATLIYATDVLFQSIIVPAGTHKIELIYRPEMFNKALALSIAGIVLAISVSLIIWRKKYR